MKATRESILNEARREAAEAKSWADFANFLYAPAVGLLVRSFPSKDERTRFMKTKEYKAIRKLIEDVQERTGLVEGAMPLKSGRFVVRLPRSLHAALEMEAAREGVSLNQWVVTKLALQVGSMMSKTAS